VRKLATPINKKTPLGQASEQKCETYQYPRILLEPLASWRDAVWFAWFVLLALFLGFTLAIFPGWFIIGPLFYDREMKNGGPFKVEDTVRILSGPQKGRISRVYATWQGNLLRVELDEKATEDFSDVFSPMELLREESAQQDAES
jgi:hypothetical protein